MINTIMINTLMKGRGRSQAAAGGELGLGGRDLESK